MLKAVFSNGILFIGMYSEDDTGIYLRNPLIVIKVSEESVKLVPFGAGFIEPKLKLPKDVITSDVSEFGKEQYEKACENIAKILAEESQGTVN